MARPTRQLFHGKAPVAGRNYLERPQIRLLLEKAIQSPLVSVVAGEGYGKTHSVYSFLQSADAAAAWLQISERDNLGWRFWENFTAAIGLYHRRLGTRLLNLGIPDTVRQFDRYITLLERERIEDQRYVVVLDDFHLIHEERVLRFVERNISFPFPNATIILISRKEPAINSVSLLSKGSLSQITADDLRFSEQEISDYFALQNITLSPEELCQIYHDSEGWALVINLVAEEMKRQAKEQGTEGKGPKYARILMKTSSFKNLEDELFSSMSKELRKFLIKLSLIEHWSPELLEKLAANAKVIEEMENFSSFIRYDVYLHAYRIHHLLLDFLKEKQGELTDPEVRDVYLQAASWCLENNLRTDAAIDCERARDYRGLINIIYAFPRILPKAIAALFMEILDRIFSPSQRRVLLSPSEDMDEDFAFLRYAVRPRLLMGLGQMEKSIEENRQSIAKFETLPASPLSSKILAACYNSLGALAIIACWKTRDYNVAPLFERSNYYYLRHPEPLEGPITQSCIGSYILQTGYPAEPGELERALREYSPAVAPASNSFNGYLYGSDTLGWAELGFFTADLNNAEKFARQAIFQGREKNQYEIENRGLVYLLRTCLYEGNFAGVEEALKQLDAQLENPGFINRYILHDIETGWFYAQIGQTEKIASWLKNDFEESELNTLFYGFETLVKAKCSFAEKRYAAVLKTLSFKEGDPEGRPGARYSLGKTLLGRLEMTVLEAAAFFKLGEKEKAFAVLKDAWEMAAPNNLDMPFIELGEDMRALAGAALAAEKTISRSWLESIRNKASVYAKKLSVVVEQYQAQQEFRGLRALTFWEMEVLNGLSQGLNREEIAEDAGLSVNAVKTVITGLYAKLGALNRADAIRIAGSAGLIQPVPD